MSRISVVIPTLNAADSIEELLNKLQNQSEKADSIIVVDSSSSDGTADIVRSFPNVDLKVIPREDFDHGRTRNEAVQSELGGYTIFLTQDAMPKDDKLIENLLQPLREDETIALSYGRQIPKSDAAEYEKLIRQFNYPGTTSIKSEASISKLGIKTFFCSDVCAAYNNSIFEKIGGFDYPIRTNEDMLYAAKAIKAGYKIAYVADAAVYHSHNLTLSEEYRRNYNIGYELERWKERFQSADDVAEGRKLFKHVSNELLKKRKLLELANFGLNCAVRLAGNHAGRRAYRND